MPAHVRGSDYFATGLASVHEGDPDGVPTLHSQLLLADAHTEAPVSVVDADGVTNAQSGCIGAVTRPASPSEFAAAGLSPTNRG